MDISFIIITDGKKPEKLLMQIKSIRALQIPNYQIVIAGTIDKIYDAQPDIRLIENSFDSERGSLGGLRNSACEHAQYENLVISDDDMLFTRDWYTNLLNAPNFEILTTCIKNPDGTRFWDNCCFQSPERGHSILNYNENDHYLYMSGGQSWLIKKRVWDKVKWDDSILFYTLKGMKDYDKGIHNEDTDFSARCRKAGFKIAHYPQAVVYHNDMSYTSIGRVVRRRTFQKDPSVWQSFNFPPEICIPFSEGLFKVGIQAEAIDLIRVLKERENPDANKILRDFEDHFGGKLENSEFTFDNQEYQDIGK